MAVLTTTINNDFFVLQEALRDLADEQYTWEKRLTGTGIVGTAEGIDVNTETFTGQMRWTKPLNPVINTASLTDPTAGFLTHTAQDYLKYIKCVHTYGGNRLNVASVVTQKDSLAKISKDFATVRAQDEHNAIMSVLRGVAISEALKGTSSYYDGTQLQNAKGGQTFDNDPEEPGYGFYVDLGASKPVIAASAAAQGAARAEAFLEAIGKAWKDYEPDYCYLVTSPKVLASLRSANLVDQDRVKDGNVEFQTIFNGKFRLIVSRVKQSFSAAERTFLNSGNGVDIVGTETTFIVRPGAIAFHNIPLEVPVEFDRNANSYHGGGETVLWYRWGFIAHPAYYDWMGDSTKFPTLSEYYGVVDVDGTAKAVADVSTANLVSGNIVVKGVWDRKATSALSLGILPIFHS